MIDDLIEKVEIDITNGGNVSEIIEKGFCNLMLDIHKASGTLPRTQFKKHSKPYWNNELSILAVNNKKAWREWVIGGRPRGTHPLFTKYKECKGIFRCAQKKAILAYEQENMDKETKTQEINVRYFWYLVNRTKKKKVYDSPIKLSTGETITKADDIREAWGDYFKELYSLSEHSDFDNDNKKRVQDRLIDMVKESYSTDEKLLLNISENEIVKIVSELKERKAPGIDGVTNEYIRYGGCKSVECIGYLFTLVVKYETIPNCFKI